MIAHLEFTNEFLIFDKQSTDKPQATQSLLSFKAKGSFDTHLFYELESKFMNSKRLG